MVYALGRGHSHGSFHRYTHPADPRVDPAELPHPRGNRAYIPGLGEGNGISIVSLRLECQRNYFCTIRDTRTGRRKKTGCGETIYRSVGKFVTAPHSQSVAPMGNNTERCLGESPPIVLLPSNYQETPSHARIHRDAPFTLLKTSAYPDPRIRNPCPSLFLCIGILRHHRDTVVTGFCFRVFHSRNFWYT